MPTSQMVCNMGGAAGEGYPLHLVPVQERVALRLEGRGGVLIINAQCPRACAEREVLQEV